MENMISVNIKRLRVAKNFTQEKLAAMLNVNTQTVSRWECGVSMPDILLLPEISRIFGVTVDDLYKEETVAYENSAHRFVAIYEATKHPDDFIRADNEFKRMFKNGDCSVNDMRMYGILHQYMMNYCKKVAENYYNKAIEMKADEYDDVYWKIKRQKLLLMSQCGRNEESIKNLLIDIENNENVREYELVITAYMLAGNFEEAYKWFKKSLPKYSDDCVLLLCGGDVCKKLGLLDDAFKYWNKALEINNHFYDAKFSIGFCYEEIGNYKKAYETWCEIVEDLDNAGYHIEKAFPQHLADKCKENVNM